MLHVPMLHCLAPLGLFFGSAALPYRHGPCLGLPYHHIGAGLLDLELNSQHPLELRPALLLGIIASQTSTTSPSPWCVHRALWPATVVSCCCAASPPSRGDLESALLSADSRPWALARTVAGPMGLVARAYIDRSAHAPGACAEPSGQQAVISCCCVASPPPRWRP